MSVGIASAYKNILPMTSVNGAAACMSIRPSYVSSDDNLEELSLADYHLADLCCALKKSKRAR